MNFRLRRPAFLRMGSKQETPLTRDAKIALFIHGCFQFGASMSGLFLNLYLWRLTEDLRINGIYNIILYASTPFVFAVGGWLAKKYDRMVPYRIGIGLIALFFLCVIYAQEQVVVYYPLFAIFNGIALGFYWVAYVVLMYDVADSRTRPRFLGVNMVVFNSAGLAGPALAGYLISLTAGLSGYLYTFAAASCLFALASLVSLRIPRLPARHRTYYLNFTGQMFRKSKAWLQALLSFFLLGLFQGIMLFLPNILMYRTVGREDQVGYLTVLFALFMIVTGVYISRRGPQMQIRRDILFATLLIGLAATVLFFEIKLWTVILFMTVHSFLAPLMVNSLTAHYFLVMDKMPLKGLFRVESMVVREYFINSGRVLSIALLILFAKEVDSPALPIVLVTLAFMQLGILLLVRNERQQQEE